MNNEAPRSHVLVDNIKSHDSFTGVTSELLQLGDDPNYVVRFMPKKKATEVIVELENVARQLSAHLDLLRQYGVHTAWVKTICMKGKSNEDGLWTIGENIIEYEPETEAEIEIYIARSAARMRGVLSYLEDWRNRGALMLYDLTRGPQWVYGKNLKGELGMFLVDLDPRFAGNSHFMRSVEELKMFIGEEIESIKKRWSQANITELLEVAADINNTHFHV